MSQNSIVLREAVVGTEVIIVENQRKRKMEYQQIIGKLENAIVEFKKDEAKENLLDVLETMFNDKIFIYSIDELKINVKFLNPPGYINKLKDHWGELIIGNCSGEHKLYFVPKYINAKIPIKSEEVWKYLFDALKNFHSINNKIFHSIYHVNNDNCEECGEELKLVLDSCSDSYCCEDHQYFRCFQC